VNRIYESEALMVSHRSAEALFRLGVIDADEMLEFDEVCLAKESDADAAENPGTKELATA